MAKFEIAQTLPEGVEESKIQLPKRSTAQSAGYDLVSPVNTIVPAHGRKLVPTGVTCKLKPYSYLQIWQIYVIISRIDIVVIVF